MYMIMIFPGHTSFDKKHPLPRRHLVGSAEGRPESTVLGAAPLAGAGAVETTSWGVQSEGAVDGLEEGVWGRPAEH